MSIPIDNQQAQLNASQSILDLMKAQKEMDKVQALLRLLEIYDIPITIGGRKQDVLNLELITEYPNAKYVKSLVKNETWRESARNVFHIPEDMQERLIGTMDTQFILKMNAHKRKREQAIVNGLKNEIAGTEVTPQPSRKKRFFGMI